MVTDLNEVYITVIGFVGSQKMTVNEYIEMLKKEKEESKVELHKVKMELYKLKKKTEPLLKLLDDFKKTLLDGSLMP